MSEVEQAYVEYCRTHGGSLTGIAGFRAGYEIGKALRATAAPSTGVSDEVPGTTHDPAWNRRAVPPGGEWVLVPREPTRAMIEAGYAQQDKSSLTDNTTLSGVYAAMLSSAPPHTAGGEWQPIETAPRDGTHILVTQAGRGGLGYCGPLNEHGFKSLADWCDVVHWFDDPADPGFYSTSWGGDQDAPFDGLTDWQPLPAPPHLDNGGVEKVEDSSVAESARRGPIAPPEPNSLPVGKED